MIINYCEGHFDYSYWKGRRNRIRCVNKKTTQRPITAISWLRTHENFSDRSPTINDTAPLMFKLCNKSGKNRKNHVTTQLR